MSSGTCEWCVHWDEEVHVPPVTPRLGDCELDVTIEGGPVPSHFGCVGFKARVGGPLPVTDNHVDGSGMVDTRERLADIERYEADHYPRDEEET
jgi:hypothetical protein